MNDDITQDYLNARADAAKQHDPLADLMRQYPAKGAATNPGTPTQSRPRQPEAVEDGQLVPMSPDAVKSLETEMTQKAGYQVAGADGNPWVDPISAFAGGAGATYKMTGSVMRSVVSGLAGAVADYPIGGATQKVEDVAPALALPFNVLTGMVSGATIERKIEEGVVNWYKKNARVPSVDEVAKKVGEVKAALMEPVGNEAGNVGKDMTHPPVVDEPPLMKVSRYGDEEPDFNKPHGLYTSPAEVESPHADLGQRRDFEIKKDANVLTVQIEDGNNLAMRQGAIGAGGGVAVARELLGADEFANLKKMGKADLIKYAQGKWPEVDWSKYYDSQEVMEGIGGMLAKDKGYDVIVYKDRTPPVDPNFDEVIILNKSAIKGEGDTVANVAEPRPNRITPDSPEAEAIHALNAEAEAAQKADAEFTGRFGKDDAPPIEPTGETVKTSVDGKPHMAVNINLQHINSEEDVKGLIKQASEIWKPSINEARRGVQTNEMTTQLAEDLNMTPEQLTARRKGQAFNAEEAYAARQLLVASAEKLNDLSAKVLSGNAGDVDRVAFYKALTLHKAIQEQVSGMTAEAGRALQQFRINVKSTQAKVKQISDIINNTVGMHAGTGEMTNLEDIAKALTTLPTLAAKNALIEKVSRATTKDILMELWINGLLSNPVTHFVNAASNAVVAAMQVPERLLASGFSAIRNTDEGVELGEALAQSYGLMEGFKDGLKAMGRVYSQGTFDVGGKVDVPYKRALSSEGLGIAGEWGQAADLLQKFMPTTALQAGDAMFKSIGYRMELRARAFRQATQEGLEGEAMARRIQELLNDPPDDIKLAAIDAASYQTFTQPLTGLSAKVSMIANQHPVMKVIIPFVKTPTNIMRYFGERSPIAPLMASYKADIKAGGARRDLAQARMAMGTAIMGVAAYMARAGLISGGGPSDPNMKAMKYASGDWQPYSVKIGDKWVAYNRLEPMGSILGIAADFSEISGEIGEEDASKIVAHGMMAIAKNVTSKTFLSGISGMIQAIDDPERYGEQWLQGMGGSMVPAVVAQVAKINDPVVREARDVTDRIRSRIPGFSENLKPRLNLWGDEIVQPDGFGPDIISPFYTMDSNPDPVSMEFIAHGATVSKPARVIDGVELNDAEYHDYAKLAGRNARAVLEDFIRGDQYQQLTDGPDGTKALALKDIVLGTRKQAQMETMKLHPELFTRINDKRVQTANSRRPVIQ